MSAVTAFAAVPSPAAAVTLLGAMQARTGGMLSAFELMPRIALEFVTRHIDGTRDPLAAPSPWYVLMEATGGAACQPGRQLRGRPGRRHQRRAGDRCGGGVQRGPGRGAVEAARKHFRSPEARRRLDQARHLRAGGGDSRFPGQGGAGGAGAGAGRARRSASAIWATATCISISIRPSRATIPAFLAQWDEVQQTVHDIVKEFGGSISAEHGIGVMKRDALPRYKSHEELDAMRALKAAFDPKKSSIPARRCRRCCGSKHGYTDDAAVLDHRSTRSAGAAAASAQTSARIQPITVQPRKKLSTATPSADGVCRDDGDDGGQPVHQEPGTG